MLFLLFFAHGQLSALELNGAYRFYEILISVSGDTVDQPIIGPGYSVYCGDDPIPAAGAIEVERLQVMLSETQQAISLQELDGEDDTTITGSFIGNNILVNEEEPLSPVGNGFQAAYSATLTGSFDSETKVITGSIQSTDQTVFTDPEPDVTATCVSTVSFIAVPEQSSRVIIVPL
jgi:hypothetical protein